MDLPKPFTVDRPEDHDANVWIGESGEEHSDPDGWIYEDVTPARVVTNDPAAEAHAVRQLHVDTEVPEPKVGAYSPFDEWSRGIKREYPENPQESFQEAAGDILEERNRLAEDIMRVLPEAEWPDWVKEWASQQVWGQQQPIKLPNPPSPMDLPANESFPKDWTSKTADTSLDTSNDNWWGPQSVNLNQGVEVPGEAPGLEGHPDGNLPTHENWIYINGNVAFGGHWWDLAHNVAMESGISPDQVKYISNMIARNQLPEGYDVAIGEMNGNYPRIWVTNTDRNAVWDAVMRELQDKDYKQQLNRVASLFR
jgi:hypothetical protein